MNFCPKCGGVMEFQLMPWFGFVAQVYACTKCGYYGETISTNHTEMEK